MKLNIIRMKPESRFHSGHSGGGFHKMEADFGNLENGGQVMYAITSVTDKRRGYRMTERTAHTPGPWEVEGLTQAHDADRAVYALTPHSRNRLYVAQVYGEGVTGKPSPERVANARLIAAAPKLLAALTVACDWLADLGVDAEHPEVVRIREAIKEAEGN